MHLSTVKSARETGGANVLFPKGSFAELVISYFLKIYFIHLPSGLENAFIRAICILWQRR